MSLLLLASGVLKALFEPRLRLLYLQSCSNLLPACGFLGYQGLYNVYLMYITTGFFPSMKRDLGPLYAPSLRKNPDVSSFRSFQWTSSETAHWHADGAYLAHSPLTTTVI
jgi:hypothetical protein